MTNVTSCARCGGMPWCGRCGLRARGPCHHQSPPPAHQSRAVSCWRQAEHGTRGSVGNRTSLPSPLRVQALEALRASADEETTGAVRTALRLCWLPAADQAQISAVRLLADCEWGWSTVRVLAWAGSRGHPLMPRAEVLWHLGRLGTRWPLHSRACTRRHRRRQTVGLLVPPCRGVVRPQARGCTQDTLWNIYQPHFVSHRCQDRSTHGTLLFCWRPCGTSLAYSTTDTRAKSYLGTSTPAEGGSASCPS